MDPTIWSNLPEELVNRICCESVRARGVHPFADEIKTLGALGHIIETYTDFYGNLDAMQFLIGDLDDQFPNNIANDEGWGVHRKWKSLTPQQRREFFIVLV
jgi:hypothetical protein